MAKLISLNVYDAKNMICVWNENDTNLDFRYGIALDNADRGFMIPRHYVVGIFDDGTTKVAGLITLNEINKDPEGDELFLFSEFCYYVDLYAAKAFVRHEVGDSGYEEQEAKDAVYERLLVSGVKIDDEARQYLTT